MKTRNQAIRHARQVIGQLSPFGGNYIFSWRDPSVNARRESIPRDYWSALANRSQALIDSARDFLGLPPVHYDGGSWLDYIPRDIDGKGEVA